MLHKSHIFQNNVFVLNIVVPYTMIDYQMIWNGISRNGWFYHFLRLTLLLCSFSYKQLVLLTRDPGYRNISSDTTTNPPIFEMLPITFLPCQIQRLMVTKFSCPEKRLSVSLQLAFGLVNPLKKFCLLR